MKRATTSDESSVQLIVRVDRHRAGGTVNPAPGESIRVGVVFSLHQTVPGVEHVLLAGFVGGEVAVGIELSKNNVRRLIVESRPLA